MDKYPDAIPMLVDRSRVFWDRNPKFAIVVHGTAGWNGATAQDWAREFATVPDKRSAHFIVDKDGTVVQCVSLTDGAGANGSLESGHDPFWEIGVENLNWVTISIEHVKWDGDNRDELTEAQKQASFKLIKWLCQTRGIPPSHIKGHNTLLPVEREHCPRNYPWSELFRFLSGGGMPVPDGWHDDGQTLIAPNHQVVIHGFREHILNGPTWDPRDMPLEHEHAQNPLEEGFNQPDNQGSRQTFNYTMLAWNATRNVYRVGLGNEFLFVNNDRARIRSQIATVLQQIAVLRQQLSAPGADVQQALAELQTLQVELQKLL